MTASAATASIGRAAASSPLMYIGTYTGPNSKGIYAFRFKDGVLEPLGVAGETANPSFLTIHQNKRWLYAANEVGDFGGQKSGGVAAFSIDHATGKLTQLNQGATKGGGACFVAVDATGKNVLVANYGGGSVAVLPIAENGSVKEASAFVQQSGTGPNEKRQRQAHAHSINLSPDNRFAIVADLGTDELISYSFDPKAGSLKRAEAFKLKPGAGPRHFTFHPNRKNAYVINELQSTVTALSYNAQNGSFTELHTLSTLPKDYSGESYTAEVQVHPSGKFLYGSNRGHDSIAVFTIDGKGALTAVEQVSTQGQTPRNFRMDPSGAYLVAANQKTNNLVVFRIDQKSGRLTPTGQTAEVASPVCIKFLQV